MTALRPSISSIVNLAGPDLLIIFVILAMLGVPIAGIILLVSYLTGRKQHPPASPTATPSSERLQQLEQLRQQKLITDAEYEATRRRILSEL
jgi:hypothetical protein